MEIINYTNAGSPKKAIILLNSGSHKLTFCPKNLNPSHMLDSFGIINNVNILESFVNANYEDDKFVSLIKKFILDEDPEYQQYLKLKAKYEK